MSENKTLPMPQDGGSYIRNPDGSLTLVSETTRPREIVVHRIPEVAGEAADGGAATGPVEDGGDTAKPRKTAKGG